MRSLGDFPPGGSKHKKFPPLRTVTELAAELKTTVHTLGHAMHADPTRPRPMVVHTGNKKGSNNTWYNPGDVRRWWKKHLKEKQDAE